MVVDGDVSWDRLVKRKSIYGTDFILRVNPMALREGGWTSFGIVVNRNCWHFFFLFEIAQLVIECRVTRQRLLNAKLGLYVFQREY